MPTLNQKTIKTYDTIAKGFSDSHFDPNFWKKEFEIFQKLISGKPPHKGAPVGGISPPHQDFLCGGKKIIDIGCGAGRDAILFKKAINLGKQAEIMAVMRLVSGKVDSEELVDQIASLLEIKTKLKQELLDTLNLKDRMDRVYEYLAHEVNVLELEKNISSKTQKRFEDQMRKAMLREKKKTIEEELGEMDEGELSNEELEDQRCRYAS